MNRYATLLALTLVALAASCGGGGGSTAAETATTPADPAEPAETTASEAPTTTADAPASTGTTAAEERPYEIWRVDGRFVRPEWQLGAGGQAVARAALDLLLAEDETAIPAGTDLRAVHVVGPDGHVDFSPELGARPSRAALAQIVYTVTQFENVESVLVTVDGQPLAAHPEPLTRDDLEDVIAPVVVLEPSGLEPVSSPIRIVGTANTFEANVTIRVVGESGEALASTFTTATCGTGCRGEFETEVEVDVTSETDVRLIVSEDDPSGGEGRPPYAVEIPLVVGP